MAVYFIAKNRLIKGVNVQQLPNKWSPRWTAIVRRSSSAKQPAQPSEGGGGSRKAGGWMTWHGVLLRWAPIGLCLAAAVQWHMQSKELARRGMHRTASQWQTNVYCSLPLRIFSRCWGWMAERRVPIPLRPTVFGAYSTAFGVNLDEAEVPDLKSYRSLSEFFTRSLKPECRSVDSQACIVSPADGKVLYFGPATDAHIEQVKGVSYSLEAFLGPPTWRRDAQAAAFPQCCQHAEESALYQCIIYLAPGDYHRFHSPAMWRPEVRRHFAGELLSVSPKIAQWLPGLFCLNERALYIGQWQHGFFSFTAVGATNVGSVQIYLDERLKTNRWIGLEVGTHKGNDFDEVPLPGGTTLQKGELLGQFNMGSTIVLIFEAPKSFKFSIQAGQKIRVGEKLGCLEEAVAAS
ncbi:phosphatidylserine decarboxylase proenzyme, mitochondrial isoform X2 [Phlebotomus argentipes]|uniref:phosphatidylserine decarboxylase proenzyme, mitochondrial isoform X2 n=1 Tax=Phlebotomus argentipes TaxID=94469 RepID=UPI0028932EBC|nr:phosphatidylserine decarboxylase proenzyme, mitochondrial isoform X2 [Phlebotomus argentipes]